MRLFIAIPVPQNVLEKLKVLQSQLPDYVSKNRHMHFTLKFLGEVQPNKVEQIKEKLSEIKFSDFEFKLDKIGFFPSEDYIRVIWVGTSPEEDILNLQKQIDVVLKPLGFVVEKDFKPHLTLARVKFLKDKSELLKVLSSFVIPEEIIQIKEFRLIQSILGKENEYETLLSVPAVNIL